MSLTTEQVRWVAHLARLKLAEDELPALTRDLGAILEYVAHLQQVDTTGIEPLAHAVELANVFRADHPDFSLPVDQALANAPQRRDDYFAVPAVLD